MYEPVNYHYSAKIMSMFVSKPVIGSLCEGSDTGDALQTLASETVAVVSVPYSESEQAVDRVFYRVFDRQASLSEKLLLYNAVHSRQTTEQDLAIDMCSTRVDTYAHFDECQALLTMGVTPWKERFPGKTYMWSVDLHVSPTACNAPIYLDAGGILHAEIDAANCIYGGTCKTERLAVFANDRERGFSLQSRGASPAKLRRAFFEAYKDSDEFERVDMFVCSYPAANCELFFPFNKSILIYVTTRLEFGRHDNGIDWRATGWQGKTTKEGFEKDTAARRWRNWIADLQHIARNPRHAIVANNRYDAEYIKWMSGIENITIIPSWCGDADDNPCMLHNEDHSTSVSPVWAPIRSEVLIVHNNIGRSRFDRHVLGFEQHPLVVEMRRAQQNASTKRRGGETFDLFGGSLKLELISTMYKTGYLKTHLAYHPAVVLIPSQVSTLGLLELYRLNIPLFAPSLDLLIKWQIRHNILWERIYGWPEPTGTSKAPSPNSDSVLSLKYWLSKCDWYHWPHVVLFSSWDDLMHKLTTTDLVKTSKAMMQHNADERSTLVNAWRPLLTRARMNGKTTIPRKFEDSLRAQGFMVPHD